MPDEQAARMSVEARRFGRAGRIGSVAAIIWLLVGSLTGTAAAAVATWQIAISPSSMAVGSVTTFKVEFANLGGPSGGDDLGCVRITLPSAFRIILPAVTDQPPGTLWTAVATGQTVSVSPPSGGDRLPPGHPSDSVTVAITVTSSAAGHYGWSATAYVSQGCKEPFDDVASLGVDVIGKATPVPTPPPTPTPTAPPTPIPTSTPTPTPTPTSTPTPRVTPRPTAGPSATATAPPGGGPGGSARPGPTATGSSSVPGPSAGTASPTPAPSGAALVIPGIGPGGPGVVGATGGDAPAVEITSGVSTPFDQGFEWAVPGLVLSVPGLLLVLAVIVVQALGAFAWLPIVRRRIGGFGVGPRSSGRDGRPAGSR